jgi:hypothetical protein
MSDATSTENQELTQLENQVKGDVKAATAQALPGIDADIQKTGDDLSADLGKIGDDIVGLAADMGGRVFADAKNDAAQFINKLPQPLPYLLQGMAASSEAVIDSLGTQAYTQLQGEEKQLIAKTQLICGSALSMVEAFFERQTK